MSPSPTATPRPSPSPSPIAGGRLIFADDFDGGLAPEWHASGNDTAEATTAEKYNGTHSVHMKVGPTDPVVYRTEVVLPNAMGRLHADHTYCLKYEFKVKGWTNFPKWITLLQTHAIPADENFRDCSAGRNSISITSNASGRLNLAVVERPVIHRPAGAVASTVWSDAMRMDHWYQTKIRIRPSFVSGGIIEVWLDGELIYSQFGANMDPYDSCGKPSEPELNIKLGLYKDRTNTGTQHVYYDDFRLTEGSSCE